MQRTKCALLAAAFVAGVSSSGHAQSSDLQGELAHCLSFSGAVERLSCYDRLARGASRAAPQNPAPPQLAAPARTEAAPNRTADFGKERLPSARMPEEDRITAEIANFRQDQAGRFTVELSNGQIWQQTAGDTARAQVRSGGTKSVVISRSSLGSYDLTFQGRNMSFKVKRLR